MLQHNIMFMLLPMYAATLRIAALLLKSRFSLYMNI